MSAVQTYKVQLGDIESLCYVLSLFQYQDVLAAVQSAVGGHTVLVLCFHGRVSPQYTPLLDNLIIVIYSNY